MHLIGVHPVTTVDGIGMRYAIYLAGCTHNCKGCHNPTTHTTDEWQKMTPTSKKKILEHIKELLDSREIRGVTLTGGDPLYSIDRGLVEFIKDIRELTTDIWLYTGYTYEEIQSDPAMVQILPHISTLVDGRFVLELRDPTLLFRGSSNQRIIDVQESLRVGEVVQLEYLY